jgi:hypothetical protein
MVSLPDLWLPILLSAVLVFIASSIIHMALPWHKGDMRRFPAEDAVLNALRPFNLPPGDYVAPMADSMREMNSPEFKAKSQRGPRVLLTVFRTTDNMARGLALWFAYLVIIGIFAAYVAGSTLGAGETYASVFRVTSMVAFASHALALWTNWIWYSRSLGYTLRTTIDGLVYALLTGGTFGWLWP